MSSTISLIAHDSNKVRNALSLHGIGPPVIPTQQSPTISHFQQSRHLSFNVPGEVSTDKRPSRDSPQEHKIGTRVQFSQEHEPGTFCAIENKKHHAREC